MTLFERLEKQFPDELKKWDKWDFNIFAPCSLDDIAEVHIILYNEDKETRQDIYINI